LRRLLPGPRLNFFVALVMTVAGLAWFVIVQRRAGHGAAGGEQGLGAGAEAPHQKPGQQVGADAAQQVSE